MKTGKRIIDMMEWTTWGKEFSGEDMEIIAGHMTLREFPKGALIIDQGERSQYMAFIVEGEVSIVKESSDELEVVLVTLRAGTHFGEMAFIDNQPRSASVYAGTDVTLLCLSVDHFERILEQRPHIGITMLRLIARLLSQRLRLTTGKLTYVRT